MNLRRIIPRVMVLLIVGAILNVAAGWGNAIFWPQCSFFFAFVEAGNIEGSFGWPMFSAYYRFHIVADDSVRVACGIDLSGLLGKSPVRAYGGHVLPVHPIWPGFAINTIFYAGILWMLFAAPFAARRAIRRRRGRCIKCNYDLRARPADSSVCPECGTPVK